MKKEFYIGQPLICKSSQIKCKLVSKFENNTGCPYQIVFESGSSTYATHGELEPSTEFKFSEIIAGLEQGYFEVGAKFESNDYATLIVDRAYSGLGLKQQELSSVVTADISAGSINTVWTLVEHHKEMTLAEIEAELGYKIKLKELC